MEHVEWTPREVCNNWATDQSGNGLYKCSTLLAASEEHKPNDNYTHTRTHTRSASWMRFVGYTHTTNRKRQTRGTKLLVCRSAPACCFYLLVHINNWSNRNSTVSVLFTVWGGAYVWVWVWVNMVCVCVGLLLCGRHFVAEEGKNWITENTFRSRRAIELNGNFVCICE